MTTLLAEIKVDDYKTWKAKYDAAKPRQSNMVEVAVGEKHGSPGDVYIIMQMGSVDEFNEILADETLKKAAVDTGIIGINYFTFIHS